MDDHTRARLASLQAAVTAFREERDSLELEIVNLRAQLLTARADGWDECERSIEGSYGLPANPYR